VKVNHAWKTTKLEEDDLGIWITAERAYDGSMGKNEGYLARDW